jgi:hypothetical protein
MKGSFFLITKQGFYAPPKLIQDVNYLMCSLTEFIIFSFNKQQELYNFYKHLYTDYPLCHHNISVKEAAIFI